MIFAKNCVVLCVSNNLILKVYISHQVSHAHILICFDPYEIKNVEQKNSSKCSNLICCRGQVQRLFPCDSLAVCRILVLLMRSNEHC